MKRKHSRKDQDPVISFNQLRIEKRIKDNLENIDTSLKTVKVVYQSIV